MNSQATGDPVIRVADLRKHYGDVKAVDGVSFEVSRGEVFGMLGPNGAGKTTTIEILESLRKPDAGDAFVLGFDVCHDADAIKQRIGVQLQSVSLYPRLTVNELLDLFGSFFERHVASRKLIDALDLGERAKARSMDLSGGQQQRLSIALALVNDPELVFLDEPTTGLDPAARRALWDVIAGLRDRGRSVLMTTHYMEEAEVLCDRIAIMDHGRILDVGTVDELVSRRFHERAARFERIAGLDDATLAGFPGVVRVADEDELVLLYTTDVPGTIGAVLAAAEGLGAPPEDLAVRRASLEDVFLELTGRALRDGGTESPPMDALLALTVANIRSFVRDRAALFWTIAFPVIFVVLFGTLFGGGGSADYRVGWVDLDRTPASARLESAFAAAGVLKLRQATEADALSQARAGDLDAVIVVPHGFGAAAASLEGASAPSVGTVALTMYTDPSHTATAQTLRQIVAGVTMGVNQELTGRPPLLAVETQPISGTANLNGPSYYVPSILAMAIMQLGVFAAIPLVQQREKLILKRLGATPLPRSTLVGSNVLLRLVIAAGQTVIILGVGIAAFHVEVTGSWLALAALVALGALAFTSLGYVIASFARTEEAANGITQVVQVPMMFLSGVFFPIALMPDWLQGVARLLPLTYLADALRQTMVGGSPFVPLALCVAVLAGWLVVCLGISARYFRWQ